MSDNNDHVHPVRITDTSLPPGTYTGTITDVRLNDGSINVSWAVDGPNGPVALDFNYKAGNMTDGLNANTPTDTIPEVEEVVDLVCEYAELSEIDNHDELARYILEAVHDIADDLGLDPAVVLEAMRDRVQEDIDEVEDDEGEGGELVGAAV